MPALGIVHDGEDLNGQSVAIKRELVTSSRVTRSYLEHEYNVYNALGPHRTLPSVLAYGTQGVFNMLVMERLGKSIKWWFHQCGRKFSLRTTVMLGVGMVRQVSLDALTSFEYRPLQLDAVAYVHSKGFIHRDIKPDNFVLGHPDHDAFHRVCLIDFGMARRYRDPATGRHAAFHEKTTFVGSVTYASYNSHLEHGLSFSSGIRSGSSLSYLYPCSSITPR